MKIFLTGCLLVFLCGSLAAQERKAEIDLECRSSKIGTKQVRQFGEYTVVVSVVTFEGDQECRADLLDRSKKRLFWFQDWSLVLNSSKYDVNNDGNPELVFEGYSGGAHCCWTYWVVSLAPKPSVVLKFENNRGASFDNRLNGKYYIETLEGGFDYFRNSHAGTYFPPVYLLLEGATLYDASPLFRKDYDDDIKEAKESLEKRKMSIPAIMEATRNVDEDTKADVMTLCLSYLYSQRPSQAWTTLNKYWYPQDRAKFKNDALKIRREGLLRHALPLPKSKQN